MAAANEGRWALSRFEPWLVRLWIASALWTLLAFAVPSITSGITVMLVFSIIGMPLAYLLTLFPTVAMYLTLAAPPYLLIRRRGKHWGAIAGACFALALGVAVPTVANRAQDRELDRITAHNRGGSVRLEPSQTVAYLYDYQDNFDWYRGCDDNCQRLLFSGAAGGVILGDTSALTGRGKLNRYWIGKRNDECPDVWTPDVFAADGDVDKTAPYPRPRLTRRLSQLEAEGNCLLEAPASLRDADIVLAHWFHPEVGQNLVFGRNLDPRLVRIDSWTGSAIYVSSGKVFKRVRRQIYVAGHSLASPLRLESPFIFDTYSPGRWASGGYNERGRQTEFGLSNFVTNDLRVLGLSPPQQSRSAGRRMVR